MKDFITISFFIILGFTSCKQKASSTQNDETDSINAVVNMENMKMKNEKFVGSWELKKLLIPFGQVTGLTSSLYGLGVIDTACCISL